MQFVEKEPTLAEAVLRALLRFWPLTNSQKEVSSLHHAPCMTARTLPPRLPAFRRPLCSLKTFINCQLEIVPDGTCLIVPLRIVCLNMRFLALLCSPRFSVFAGWQDPMTFQRHGRGSSNHE